MNTDIKNNRMADATLTVLKADGTPLANQEVVVQQTSHKFLFGTAAFDLVSLANGEYTGAELEQAEQRAAKLTALFNAATLPFYWARFEPKRGQPLTEKLKNAAYWCAQHSLLAKGHPLCWHTLTADCLLGGVNSGRRQPPS
jgi:endo-1,4-beta-xylanase